MEICNKFRLNQKINRSIKRILQNMQEFCEIISIPNNSKNDLNNSNHSSNSNSNSNNNNNNKSRVKLSNFQERLLVIAYLCSYIGSWAIRNNVISPSL